MSSAERISKRPKTKSVTLIDLPKANTGLAIKAIHKNNTVKIIVNYQLLQIILVIEIYNSLT